MEREVCRAGRISKSNGKLTYLKTSITNSKVSIYLEVGIGIVEGWERDEI